MTRGSAGVRAYRRTMHLFRGNSVSHANEDRRHISKKLSAQFALAKKKAELKRGTASRQPRIAANAPRIAEAELAADVPHHRDEHGGGRAPPVHLLDKKDILEITNVTFPTIWAWMRAGTFPRSRVVGGKSMWLSSEIDAWLADLPMRALKGDAEVEVSMPSHVQKPGAGDRSESAP
jgi:predicted DNA-binding transcriptional regulator AlpA